MNSAAYTMQRKNAINTYASKEIMEATPQKLVLKVYDFAIAQCKLKNVHKTNRALMVLIEALNFEGEAKEISLGLLKLYQFAQNQMRKKNFDLVYNILTGLRDSWVETFTANKG